MRIYVVNLRPNVDISEAQRQYPDASLVLLSEGKVELFKCDVIARDFSRAFQHSEPDDMLLLAGALPLNLIAGCAFMARHGKANLLIFHAKSERYVARTITREQVLGNG
jgi:hypothetical protein